MLLQYYVVRVVCCCVIMDTVIQTVSILNKPDYLKYYLRINI